MSNNDFSNDPNTEPTTSLPEEPTQQFAPQAPSAPSAHEGTDPTKQLDFSDPAAATQAAPPPAGAQQHFGNAASQPAPGTPYPQQPDAASQYAGQQPYPAAGQGAGGYPPQGPGQPMQPPQKKRPWCLIIALIVLALLVLLGVGIWWAATSFLNKVASEIPTALPTELIATAPADTGEEETAEDETSGDDTAGDDTTDDDATSDDTDEAEADDNALPQYPKKIGDYKLTNDPSGVGVIYQKTVGDMYLIHHTEDDVTDFLRASGVDLVEIGEWACQGNTENDLGGDVCVTSAHGGTIWLFGLKGTEDTAQFGDKLLAMWK